MSHHPHLPRRSAAEQQRVEDMLRELFDQGLSFHQLTGFRVASLDVAAPQLHFAMRMELIGHRQHGRLHGGVIAAALDAAGGLAVTVGMAEKFNDESAEQIAHRFGRVGTIDLRTDFLHQGIGNHFTATGRLTRLGGRIASTQMTLENEDGLLIATGCGSYIVS